MSTTINLSEYFNKLSEVYNINEHSSFYTTNYMRRKLINKIKLFNNKSLLDIMSGTGENLKYIKSKNSNMKITTVDFSSKMNQIARLNHKNKIVHQIENNFFEIDQTKEVYDIILCSFGIKTIDYKQLNLFSEKLNQLLKPNGEILLLELVRPKNKIGYRILKYYLNKIIPSIFGEQFKLLFPYINNHKNMNNLMFNIKEKNMEIIEHKRYFDLFEIIHAKKCKTNFTEN